MKTYNDKLHFYGRVWGWLAATAIAIFPFVLGAIFQVWPSWEGVGKGLLSVAPIFWTVGLIEVFTYTPMLGPGSAYLGFVTGNLTNLKVPCALECMESAGVKAGTEEADVISTISTAVSSIVTMVIIFIGVLLITPLTPILEKPILEPAFNNILPALFGGLGVVYISKNWKIAVVPVLLMLVLFIAVPFLDAGMVGIMVPVGAVVAIASSRVMYKKGIIGNENPSQKSTAHENEQNNDEKTNKE